MNQATGGDRAHSRTGFAHRHCERAPDMTELDTTNRRAFANRLDRRTLRASCVGVAILAAMLAGTAQAQTGDGARGSTLDSDIVVTATKTEAAVRSEEHTSELQSLMRISYAVFCLKK